MADEAVRWRAILTMRRAEEYSARGVLVREREAAAEAERRGQAAEVALARAREVRLAVPDAPRVGTAASLERAEQYRARLDEEVHAATRERSRTKTAFDRARASLEAARGELEAALRRRQAAEKEGRRRRQGRARIRTRREEIAVDDALRGRPPRS